MTVLLAKYEAARRALAEAVAVDEVKAIHDHAEALRHAARIAGDKQLEIQAAQIRFRAQRRFGELMEAQHAAGKVARGGRPRSEKPLTICQGFLMRRRRSRSAISA